MTIISDSGTGHQQRTGGLMTQVSWLGLRLSGHLTLFYIIK